MRKLALLSLISLLPTLAFSAEDTVSFPRNFKISKKMKSFVNQSVVESCELKNTNYSLQSYSADFIEIDQGQGDWVYTFKILAVNYSTNDPVENDVVVVLEDAITGSDLMITKLESTGSICAKL